MSAMIKQTARALLTAGGPNAISVRAIAREIGVTPAAIYRYYSSVQELVDELQADILGELDARIESVHNEVADSSPAIRGIEMVRAFWQWTVEHPREFWLALSPGPADSCGLAVVTGREPRVAAHFFREFLRSHKCFSDEGDLARQLVSAFLSAWARLLGLVLMEISGQAKWMPIDTTDFEALFEVQLKELSDQLTSGLG